MSWRTFEYSIFGGTSPRWRRNAYYRLVWKKATGAELDMSWRYEQEWYSGRGWIPPAMMWNSHTGLLSINILPESKGPEGAVVRYIARTKGWNRSEYNVEHRGMSPDGKSDVFAVIYLCDGCSTGPGAEKSVLLYLDPGKQQVTQEIGWQ